MLDDNDSTPTLGDEAPTDGLTTEPADAGPPSAPDAPPADSGAAESAPGSGSADAGSGSGAGSGDAGPAEVASTGPEAAAAPAAKKTARKRASRPRKTAAAAVASSVTDAATAAAGQLETPAQLPTEPVTAEAGMEQLPTPGEEPAQSPAPGTDTTEGTDGTAAPARKAAKRAPAKRTATKKSTARTRAAKSAAASRDAEQQPAPGSEAGSSPASATTGTGGAGTSDDASSTDALPSGAAAETDSTQGIPEPAPAAALAATSLLFKAPDPVVPPRRRPRRSAAVVVPGPERTPEPAVDEPTDEDEAAVDQAASDAVDAPEVDAATAVAPEPATDEDTDGSAGTDDDADDSDDSASSDEQGTRRRRRRGGRRRRRGAGDGEDGADGGASGVDASDAAEASGDQSTGEQPASGGGRGGRGGQRGDSQRDLQRGDSQRGDSQRGDSPRGAASDDSEASEEGTGSRRRRRRRRTGEDDGGDESGTTARVRKPRNAEDEITSLHGSTRLEAKKQRRREGREAGRRRAPIVSEAEFLARREAVERVMVIRQQQDLTQIAVLEDKVLVEHYVARESQTSLIGNVYLGRVQNVLPSMEAAFIDIGKGRNAVLYAGEVNWDALGAGNGPRKIEQVLKSGQAILVQVSKDPIGHKGARLTSQVSLPGRFLVYVPDGTTSGISRKLPDTERSRLKTLLKEIVPDSAGVIVRTAAEGASEEELTLDVERLTARWAEIEAKIAAAPKTGGGTQLLYGEPDLTLKVVRDLFTEDFAQLVIAGDDAWDTVQGYVQNVAPDLEERLERYDGQQDVFAAYRVDEQIAKGLDRKVWLPSGGSLVIDRTEAMTVVDVNTGKFTGSGGNLEETVTKNNLEAAEEIVRQLRLRDIGGIIVVDFIDMVLESNRDLVLRRLVECLGRDRTRHQVAEVTSLGLVQMTRKRIGTGLLESFSENCDHCQGRGVVIAQEPVEPRKQLDDEPRRGGRRGRGRGDSDVAPTPPAPKGVPSPKDIAAMARHEPKPPVAPDADAATPAEVSDAPALVSGDAPADVSGDAATLVSADAPSDLSDDTALGLPDVPDDGHDAGAAAVPTYAVDATTQVPDASGDAPTAGRLDTDFEAAEVAADDPGADQLGEESLAEQAATPSLAGPQVTGPPTDDDATPDQATARVDVPASDEPPVSLAAPEAADVDGQDGRGSSGDVEPTPPTAPAVPAGPRLVTSTRRRVARRPAGPPAAAAVDGLPAGGANGAGALGTDTLVQDEARDDQDDDSQDATSAHGEDAPHVPVKKRGRRR